MHMSSPGFAFAKSIKQELEDYLEVNIAENVFLTFGNAYGKTKQQINEGFLRIVLSFSA